jgi:hypothetical protein
VKTIQTIIDILGGLQTLQDNPIRLEAHGFMPLAIELIGSGPRGFPLVSVMHYYEQHGDICRDPDMEFEIDQDGKWHPVSYRQNSIGMMQEAVFIDSETGEVKVRPRIVKDLKRFARQWSDNLAEQGFLEAARDIASKDNSQE